MRTVRPYPTIWFSDMVCPNPNSIEVFAFPTLAESNDMLSRGVIIPLKGFENSECDGGGNHFNFILENGARSKQRDKILHKEYSAAHLMPTDACNKIKSVLIYYKHGFVFGFEFFDRDGKRLWKIGSLQSYCDVSPIVLSDNEVIVGVVAKL